MFGTHRLESLHCLLAARIRDLHDGETRLVKALPKLVESSRCKKLRDAFLLQLDEAHDHITRLGDIAGMLDIKLTGKACKAMKGLLEEAECVAAEKGDGDVVDLSIITAARQIAHHEISGYASTVEIARQLGLTRIVLLLEDSLREEKASELKFERLAASHLAVAPHIPCDEDADEKPPRRKAG